MKITLISLFAASLLSAAAFAAENNVVAPTTEVAPVAADAKKDEGKKDEAKKDEAAAPAADAKKDEAAVAPAADAKKDEAAK